MSASSNAVSAPVVSPVAVKAAKYPESAVISVTKLGSTNPKRGASAKRYAVYLSSKAPLTVGAYLDACLALQPEESRYRWRADLAWDIKRGFITVA